MNDCIANHCKINIHLSVHSYRQFGRGRDHPNCDPDEIRYKLFDINFYGNI